MKNFKDKRVYVLGLGVENTPLIKWLVEHKAKVVVGDKKRKGELPLYPELKNLPVEFRLGPRYLDDILDFDIIFRTPGATPATKEKLQEAANMGVAVSSQTELFFELCPAPIIGVTGTNGKGTVSSLIFEMLKEAGLNVKLGGNIGNPPIVFVDTLTSKNWVVLELSSFQVEDLTRSPHIAVILGVTPDHLDVHLTFDAYLNAKKQLVRNQAENDIVVLAADYSTTREFAVETPAQKYWFSKEKPVERGAYVDEGTVMLTMAGRPERVVSLNEIQLVGIHNLENIAAACVAAALAHVPVEHMRQAAKSFRGLPHRLSFIGNVGGVKYYDDSYATTPPPTIAAIKSFNEPLTVILGGSSKKSNFCELGALVARHSTVKHVILLGNTEAPKIRAAIEAKMGKEQVSPEFYSTMSMETAVKTAKELAKPGEVVLLSPAAASFDLFKNYKDRGEQFIRAVNNGS